MTRRFVVPMVLAVALGFSFAQSTKAEDGTADTNHDRAGRVAKRCIRHAKGISARASRQSRHVANRCVKAVGRQLGNDNEERALTLSERSKELIHRRSDAAVKRIEKISQRCIDLLRKHDDLDHAERVAEACQDAAAKVRQRKADAVAAIDAALGSGGGSPDGGSPGDGTTDAEPPDHAG